jgi:carboxylesterase
MGTVQTVRDWAMAFAQADFAVEAPLLPGHGTSVEEMVGTRWSDYVRSAEASYKILAQRHQHVFVGGLCTGGTLGALLAVSHPEIAGLISINGFFQVPKHWKKAEFIQDLLKTDRQFFPWFRGKTMEDPQAPPLITYEQSPLASMLSISEGRSEASQHLSEIHCPVLVFTSQLGTGFTIESGEPWFADIPGPVEHIPLERSNHVATLDYDKGIIETRSVAFALAITKSERYQALKQ